VRRPGITVRDAQPEDAESLGELWLEARKAAGPAGHTLGPGTPEAMLGRIGRAQGDPRCRLVVATHDGALVGFACFQFEGVSPLDETPALHVAYLHVLASHRRHGVGSALLEAAADAADAYGAQQVVVSVPQSLREANRFYARLGLAPDVAHRSASTSTLRRRLEGEAGGLMHDLLSQRRRSRTVLTGRAFRATGQAPEV
jgi:GNAT superfamily N-acetyltransferase